MSQFPTGTTTYSPASLTEQERTDFRTEMDVAKTNGDITEDFNGKTIILDGGATTSDNYPFLRTRKAPGTESFQLTVDINSVKLQRTWTPSEDYLFRSINNGNFMITGAYSPFTGTHIATSKEELKVGELVSLHSTSLDDKQPLWEANYCVASKKGVYGVVYDKFEDKYLIACVGDAVVNFSNENGPCEAGDYLVPSATKKGCVMVHKGEFVPLNQCGKAGEATNENKLIAWVKE